MSLIPNSRPYRMYRTAAGGAGRGEPQRVARFRTVRFRTVAVVALATLAALAGCSQVPCALGLGRACATTVSAVAVAPSHTLVLKSDGTLWAWGRNASGQLGDGTATDRAGPVQVGTASRWHAVAAGAVHTVATRRNGTLWAWGSNGAGQLGDGTTTDRRSPVQVDGGGKWRAAAAGSGTPSRCAVTGRCGPGAGTTSASSATARGRTGRARCGWARAPAGER